MNVCISSRTASTMPLLIRDLRALGLVGLLAAALTAPTFAAPATEVRLVRDVAFLPEGRSEKLDLYLPPVTRPAAVVIWIHGGGWKSGTKSEARAKEICTTLADACYVAASIDYRLGDDAWPQCLL